MRTSTKKAANKPIKNKALKSKSTGNKELDKMLVSLNEAKKKGSKSLVVFTTNKSHHKANAGVNGFGVSDLKPKFLEAYKHLFRKFDVSTRLVNANEMAVEWIVKF